MWKLVEAIPDELEDIFVKSFNLKRNENVDFVLERRFNRELTRVRVTGATKIFIRS